MIPIPSFLINFVVFRILRVGLGWVGNTIVGGVGVGVGGGVVDDLPVRVPVHLPFLPEEVLIQKILVRLPVISLLRFKSVCKSWRDLIQSSFFIHLHTTTTFNSSSSSSSSCSMFGDPNTFILQISPHRVVDGRSRMEQMMFMLSFGSGSSGSGDDDIEQVEDDDDDQVVFKMDNLGLPPYYTYMKINMVGSCNGLICLHDAQLRNVYLWNPATRQFRILPKSITIQEKKHQEEEEEEEKDCGDFIAFGFDVKTKDYKVVQINRRFCISQMLCRVQVYSLSTDCWRLLEGINSLPADPTEEYFINHGVYLNGSYFFVGRKHLFIEYPGDLHRDYLMLSFDFTKEIFTTIQLPVVHNSHNFFLLTHLVDTIALFTIQYRVYYEGDDDDDDDQPRGVCVDDHDYYDVWVLDEQGGGKESSWVKKLHSLRIKEIVAGGVPIYPKGLLNNGEFALIETKRESPDGALLKELHLLNLVTKKLVKSFPIRERVSRANIYKQSLASIIGGKGTTTTNRVVGGAMIPIVNQG